MSHTKKHKCGTHNVPFCDVSIQDRYEDNNFFQHCKPPPPPGNEDLWELQFCRWWGWNWVRKKDTALHCKEHDVHSCRDKKPEKKHAKALCNCLCFKKEPRITPSLQNLYNTPSNTIRPEKTCDLAENKMDSVEQLQQQRNISQKSKRGSILCNKKQKSNDIQWEKMKNDLDSSSDDYCHYSLEKFRSSTDEDSIEYINISCHCPCYKKMSTPDKYNCETQTSKQIINMNANVTQTSQRHSMVNIGTNPHLIKPKKKKIRLICCHCSQNPKCKCHKLTEESPKKLPEKSPDKQPNKPPNESPNNPAENSPNKVITSTQTECPVMSTMEATPTRGWCCPWNSLLYYNTLFPKFGYSSRKYPWLLESKSDIWDKLYSLKIEQEFASPLSGNIYNLTPEKTDIFDTKHILPDPIEISEKMNYLKELENEIKMDLTNRVMLDAVCDAILSDRKTSASAILEEFNFSHESESDNGINEIKNKNNDLDEINYFGIRDTENELISDLDTIPLHTHFDNNQDSNFLTHSHDLKILLERKFSEINMSSTMALNYDLMSEQVGLKKIVEKNSRTRNTHQMRINSKNKNVSIATTRILNSSIRKRGEAPPFKFHDNFSITSEHAKRRTKRELSTDAPTPNISEIFNKIDEIVLKSKVHNEEIQNVLNSIPRKDYRIRSSEDITNSIKDDNLFLKISTTTSTLKDDTDVQSMSKLEESKLFLNTDEKGDQTTVSTKTSEIEGVKKVCIARKRKKGPKASLIPIKHAEKQKNKKK